MTVLKTIVTQVRVFDADSFDGSFLLRTEAVKFLSDRYSFQPHPLSIGIPVDSNTLKLTKGVASVEGKRIPIESLVFEPRRVVLTVIGSSQDAEMLYGDIVQGLVSQFSEVGGTPDIIVLTQETTTIIDESSSDLLRPFFSAEATEFCAHLAENVSSEYARASIEPFAVLFRVTYHDVDPEVMNRSVTLLSKRVRIERRHQRSPGDGRYFIVSPTDSETHSRILDAILKLAE